jgi:two-component SAPR family response regulator
VAHLLEIVGSIDDIPLLRAFEHTSGPSGRAVKFAQRLAERTSPPLEIFDLGETRLALGSRVFQASEMRRKSAALLMYLASRARQAVTREQVLEDLWPSLSPPAASNSLNQTLYFLRRAIDPWYEDGFSVDYLRNEAEVVGLSPALVRITSVEFHTVARELLRQGQGSIESALPVLDRYRGRFAPEFEYEEWSLDWRELVHTTYLDLVVATQRWMIQVGNINGAAAVARHALLIDPRNPDLHEGMIWTLAATGSRPAVSEQYAHFAALYREEYGAEPPALETIASAPFLASQPTPSIRK